MAYVCYYCDKPFPGGKLRMVPDKNIGSAFQSCCHDCFHTHGDEPLCADFDDCAWLSFKTADEWHPAAWELDIAAQDDRAHALRDRRAGL